MKRKSLIFATAALMLAFAFTSCQNDEEVLNPLVENSMDDDEVTTYYDDVLAEADDLTLYDTKEAESVVLIGGSGTRTHVTSFSGDTVIKTITFINFVNGNSQMERVKNGQIIVKIIRHQFPGEFKRIITFNNFTINGNLIEGKKQVVRSTVDQYEFTISLAGGKVTFTDGTSYTRELTHTRTMIDGMLTPGNIWDDVFSIEGVASGVNRKRLTYTHTIQNALIHKLACRWLVQGTVEFVVGENTALLDYGMGECDNIATVTINGATKEIQLRGRRRQ